MNVPVESRRFNNLVLELGNYNTYWWTFFKFLSSYIFVFKFCNEVNIHDDSCSESVSIFWLSLLHQYCLLRFASFYKFLFSFFKFSIIFQDHGVLVMYLRQSFGHASMSYVEGKFKLETEIDIWTGIANLMNGAIFLECVWKIDLVAVALSLIHISEPTRPY